MKKDARHATDRMISGKLRKRAARPGVAVRTVDVDGTEYTWSTRHSFRPWGRGVKAISISVSLRPARTRELILDLTLALGPEDPSPGDARVAEALPAAIRSALDAGWDPESRGRAFRHEMTGSF